MEFYLLKKAPRQTVLQFSLQSQAINQCHSARCARLPLQENWQNELRSD